LKQQSYSASSSRDTNDLAFALLKETYYYNMHAFANNGLRSEDPACMVSPTCYAVVM